MRVRRFKPVAGALVVAIVLSGVAAGTDARAQGADSVEGFMRRVFGPPEQTRDRRRERDRRPGGKAAHETRAKAPSEPAAKPEASPVVAVPLPPVAVAAPIAVPVPSPDPRPDADSAGAVKAGAGEAAPPPAGAPIVAPVAGSSAAPDGPTPVPGQPNLLRPPPIESQPPEDIPVPDERPAAAPGDVAAPGSSTTPAPPDPSAEPKPPVEGPAGVEPPRPGDAPNSAEKLKSRLPVIDPATSVVAAAAIEDAERCEAELKRRGAVFEVKPSISEGECGVLRPISFERSSSGVKVGPNTQMLCRAALALDVWLADSVVPAAKANFSDRRLAEFRQASTYVCRPRASENGISEHARGSAIDIGAFVFDKGGEIGVAAQPEGSSEDKFQDAVRGGACGPFKTVLGPGTDADHATHFHLDIAARRNGSTYCK